MRYDAYFSICIVPAGTTDLINQGGRVDASDWNLYDCCNWLRNRHPEAIDGSLIDPDMMSRKEIMAMLTISSTDMEDGVSTETLRKTLVDVLDEGTIKGLEAWRARVEEYSSRDDATRFKPGDIAVPVVKCSGTLAEIAGLLNHQINLTVKAVDPKCFATVEPSTIDLKSTIRLRKR